MYQGRLGDCWLLASFAETAAQDPTAIQNLFTDDGTTVENGATVHLWTIRFFSNGTPQYLTVDNYLPAAGSYAATPRGVLWVALLEKAYAQLSESGWNYRPQANAYSSLNGGTAMNILPVLTNGQDNYFGDPKRSRARSPPALRCAARSSRLRVAANE